MIKALNKLGREEVFHNLIKGIWKKPIANIIPAGEKVNAFPLKIKYKATTSTLITSLQHGTGGFSQENRQKQRQKIRKYIKMSSFSEDMILYVKNIKKIHIKCIRT